ncbi:unnamed protein product [Darwinula stevensoni]|uniref:Uncharacterized protein n=1 Tax=Darwinula stevensoni TaxID=69355 RepID=A0A7R8XDU9_9CRUS|nr:unnamed protein product [Darwinula stevensoni]CAG0889952.1 unnamed protein product [Darwinula stevensoni]
MLEKNEWMMDEKVQNAVHFADGMETLKRDMKSFKLKMKQMEDYMTLINGPIGSNTDKLGMGNQIESQFKIWTTGKEAAHQKLDNNLVNGMERLKRNIAYFRGKLELMERTTSPIDRNAGREIGGENGFAKPSHHKSNNFSERGGYWKESRFLQHELRGFMKVCHTFYADLTMPMGANSFVMYLMLSYQNFGGQSGSFEIHVHSKEEPFTDSMKNVPTTDQTLYIYNGRSYFLSLSPRNYISLPSGRTCSADGDYNFSTCVEDAVANKFLKDAPCLLPFVVPEDQASMKSLCSTSDDFGQYVDFYEDVKQSFSPGCLMTCDVTTYSPRLTPDAFSGSCGGNTAGYFGNSYSIIQVNTPTSEHQQQLQLRAVSETKSILTVLRLLYGYV